MSELSRIGVHHILSTPHIHLDHGNCLEVLAVGEKLADALTSTKGVEHGRLTITPTDAEL